MLIQSKHRVRGRLHSGRKNKKLARNMLHVLLIAAMLFSMTPLAVLAEGEDPGSRAVAEGIPIESLFSQNYGSTVEVPVGYFDTSHAVMELQAGSVTEDVYGPIPKGPSSGLVAPPELDALPSSMYAASITVTGRAEPGAVVVIRYSVDDEEIAAGEVEADSSSGYFSADVDFPGDGIYIITAVAMLDDVASEASAPMMIEIDTLSPGPVTSLWWELTNYNAMTIDWMAPYIHDEEEGYIEDPTIEAYEISVNGEWTGETDQLSFHISDLQEGSLYIISVAARDRAGNYSEASEITAGTSYATERKIADWQMTATEVDDTHIAMSADGRIVVYTSAQEWDERYHDLYVADIESGQIDNITSPVEDSDYSDHNQPAISEDGMIIAYATTYATYGESQQSKVHVYDRSTRMTVAVELPEDVYYLKEVSISRDGGLVVIVSDQAVYLYDRMSDTLQSVMPHADRVSSAQISGDGSVVAYLTQSFTGEVDLGIYEVATQELTVSRLPYLYAGGLSISDDGTYVAYYARNEDDYDILLRYNWVNHELLFVDEGSADNESVRYQQTWISSDGRFVMASLNDWTMGYRYHGVRWFDMRTMQTREVGNPALDVYTAAFDQSGRLWVYQTFEGLYLTCAFNCDATEPPSDQLIRDMDWNAPPRGWVGGQLLPGVTLDIAASADPGLALQSVITYDRIEDGNISEQQQMITLGEHPADSGQYTASFFVGMDMTRIHSISVELTDGTGKTQAEFLPVDIAGSVSVHLEPDQAWYMDQARLVFESLPPYAGRYEVPVAGWEQGPLVIHLPSGRDYRARLLNGSVLLAERDAFTVSPGVENRFDLEIDSPPIARLRVTVTDPFPEKEKDWGGFLLTVVEMEQGRDYRQYSVNGPSEHMFDLLSDRNYKLRLIRNGELIEEQIVSLASGQVVNETVVPAWKGDLKIHLVDQNGVPVSSGSYIVYSPDGFLTSNSLNDTGTIHLHNLRWMGDTFRLTFSPRDIARFLNFTEEIVLHSQDEEVVVAVPERVTVTLTGRVTDISGTPIDNARVSGSMIDLPGQSYFTTTDENGFYQLEVPSGTVMLQVQQSDPFRRSTPNTVLVSPQHRTEFDFILFGKVNLQLDLYTKYADGDWHGPLDLDWRTAVHMGLNISSEVLEWGSPLTITPRELGSKLNVCVDGREARLPAECKEVIIESEENKVEFWLEQQTAKVAGTVEGAEDQAYSIFLYNITENDALSFVKKVRAAEKRFVIEIPERGSYRAYVEADNGATGVISGFSIISDREINIGPVYLQSPKLMAPGSRISVADSMVSPGGTIQARADFTVMESAVEGISQAELVLDLPAEVELVSGSVALNGVQVEPRLQSGSFVVSIDNDLLQPGETVAVTYRLRTGDDPLQTRIGLSGRVYYSSREGSKDEQLSNALVHFTRIRMDVPSTITSHAASLSGQAPASSLVSVFEEQQLLGTTKVSPSGFWRIDVELKDSGNQAIHRLHAEAELGNGERITTPVQQVRFDRHAVRLQNVTLQQPDGRVISVDPAQGVARFPYVFVPFYGFVVTMEFDDPERVFDVRVRMGNEEVVARYHNGKYEALLEQISERGPIWIEYKTKPGPASQYELTEEALRSRLPEAWRHFQLEDVQVSDASNRPITAVSAETMSAGDVFSAATQLQLSEDFQAQVSVGLERVEYTPTEKDLAMAETIGAELYGVSMSTSFHRDELKLSFTGYIPEQALEPNARATADMPFGLYRASATAAVGAMKETIEVTLKVMREQPGDVWDLYSAWEMAKSVFDQMNDPTFDQLGDLLDQALQNCSPDSALAYNQQLMDIADDYMASKYLQWGLDIAAVFIAPETFGLGTLAIWGATAMYGAWMDSVIENKIADVANQMSGDDDCEEDEEEDDESNTPPVMDPVWIYDPSGYVFEGIPANRLEGVEATALMYNEEAQRWEVWDAEWFEQINPQFTDGRGRYGWNVPEGNWKVSYRQDGYEPAESWEMTVLPEHFDVNIGMVSYHPPKWSHVYALPDGAGVEIRFTKPMLVHSIQDGAWTVTQNVYGAEPALGVVEPIDPGTTPDGYKAALAFRFTPHEPLALDSVYDIAVGNDALSYALIPLADEEVRQVTISGQDELPPEEVSEVSIVSNDTTTHIVWTNPDDLDYALTRLYWKREGADAFEEPIELAGDRRWAELTGLAPGQMYRIRLTTVDRYGNESRGVERIHSMIGEAVATPDWVGPSSISNISLDPASTTVALTWIDPVDRDLSQLKIRWNKPGEYEAELEAGAQIEAGVQQYVIQGLKPDTVYEVGITAFDEAGNASATVIATTKTLQGEEPPTTPPGGGPGGYYGPVPTPSTDVDEIWRVGEEAEHISAFDGLLELDFAANTFTGEVILRLAEFDEPTDPLPQHYSQFSRIYKIWAEQEDIKPDLSFRIEIDYDADAAKELDVRRLGIYRQDEADPERWIYVGGAVDREQGRISATIDSFGVYTVLLYDYTFADLAGHWSRPEVEVLISRHIVNGVNPNEFQPDRAVTRAEFMKLFVEWMRMARPVYEQSAQLPAFRDVSSDAWYAEYILEAVERGWAEGYEDGTFRPDKPITREEMAVLLFRAQAGSHDDDADGAGWSAAFTDADQVSTWARNAMTSMIRLGIIKGMTDTEIQPQGTASRAQAAVVLLRMIESNKN